MKKKSALVIDDEQIVLDSITKILVNEIFKVDVTLEGKIGIQMAIGNDYDIVLTDIRMPDIGGLIVLRDIKRKKPKVPVAVITGYATVRSAVQAMKLGAADYLEKPFTPEELMRLINTVIESAKTQKPEEQNLIHQEEVIKVLDRAASDSDFARALIEDGSEALKEYQLTGPEKLALTTCDIDWIESQIGSLQEAQKQWLKHRISAEIW
jgi:DNA-binding NtrC family response regulator